MEANNEFEKFLDLHTKRDSLMIVLEEAEKIYGYLPFEVLNLVSQKLDTPLEEIYSVASFYNQFKFEKEAKYKVSVCLGTVCYVKGASDILEEVKDVLGINLGEMTEDGLFSIVNTRCLGCCSLAPVMMINDKVYSKVKKEDVSEIIDSYRGS